MSEKFKMEFWIDEQVAKEGESWKNGIIRFDKCFDILMGFRGSVKIWLSSDSILNYIEEIYISHQLLYKKNNEDLFWRTLYSILITSLVLSYTYIYCI